MDDAMDIWIRETNRRGEQLPGRWRPTDRAEMLLFLAAFFNKGLVRSRGERAAWSRDEIEANPHLQSIISYNRWTELKRATHLVNKQKAFDEGTGDPKSGNFDRLHKIRAFLDAIVIKFQRAHNPDVWLSLDETMCKCKGNYRFICVLPNKPISKGIKLFVLSCATCAHVLNIISYCASDFQLTQQLGATGGTVIGLMRSENLFGRGVNYLHKGHRVFFDNYYTMLQLLYVLLVTFQTYAAGTMRTGRGVPAELANEYSWERLNANGQPEKMIRGEFKMMSTDLISIVHWSDGGKCIVAWNFPDINGQTIYITRTYKNANGCWVTDHEMVCPKIISWYNQGMGAVDLDNQHVAAVTHHIKSQRWYMCLFWKGIDFCSLDAYIGHKEVVDVVPHFKDFRKTLIRGLKQLSNAINGMTPEIMGPGPNMIDATIANHPPHQRQTALSLKQHPPIQTHKWRLLKGTNIYIRKLRLDGSKDHVLVRCELADCVVHAQRKRSTWMCQKCRLAMCPGMCRHRFHTEVDYVWNDESLATPIRRTRSTC